jgi:hypothetical protein
MKNKYYFFLLICLFQFGSCKNKVKRKFNNFEITKDLFSHDELSIDFKADTNYLKSEKKTKLFISTLGSDDNSGKSYKEAVLTLYRVHKILMELKPKSDVEIYIDTGVYIGQQVNWSFVNGKKITITGFAKNNKRPIFNGIGKETWFRLDFRNGKNTNLNFRFLEIINYNLGVGLTGDRDNPKKGWNGGNVFYKMSFKNIGSKFSVKKNVGYSAINLVNSRENKIINCVFENIENIEKNGEEGLIHALYFAHYSSNNLVKDCSFLNVSGDPIRVRDESNYNRIIRNFFKNAGITAFFSEWYCSSETTTRNCTKKSGECSSLGNLFLKNKCNNGYAGKKIDLIKLYGNDSLCGKTNFVRLKYSKNKII